MGFFTYLLLVASCAVLGSSDGACLTPQALREQVAGIQAPVLVKTGEAVDVVLTAQAALVWDVASGEVLYEKEADATRPVASLSKLLTVLAARQRVAPEAEVLIGEEAVAMQRRGAHIKLPLGERVRADQLYQAALVASANDAAVSLAVAASGSEEKFVDFANTYGQQIGLADTRLVNATGLSGEEQHSTAREVKELLMRVYRDAFLRPYLSAERGVLVTKEGSRRSYLSTNQLIGTYLPILAGKTGYTLEAGENLAVLTYGPGDREIGVVVLGSEARFHDTKVLVEWVRRNYTWQ